MEHQVLGDEEEHPLTPSAAPAKASVISVPAPRPWLWLWPCHHILLLHCGPWENLSTSGLWYLPLPTMPLCSYVLSLTPPSSLQNSLHEFSVQLLTNITSFLLRKQAQETEVTCSGLHMCFFPVAISGVLNTGQEQQNKYWLWNL